MRPPRLIRRLGVVKLDVQVLIDAFQLAADADFVFELDGDFVLDECFEEAANNASQLLVLLTVGIPSLPTHNSSHLLSISAQDDCQKRLT